MVNMETNSRERRIIDDVLQRDKVFRYKLLGRLQSDCEYYLNYGNRNTGRLWAGMESWMAVSHHVALGIEPGSSTINALK